MSGISRLIEQFIRMSMKTQNELSILACTFSNRGATDEELTELLIADAGLVEFWRMNETAELFKDIKYGQWGLQILSPKESTLCTHAELIERPDDMRSTDLVFAEFMGDSDQLLMDLSFEHASSKPIYVKLPIDRRHDWPKIASSFEDFLEKYLMGHGKKFWELRRHS